MRFEIRENVIPSLKELIELYHNVGWSNYTNNENMLFNAYKNSLYVVTAWDKDKLIGAARIVGDGYSIIYIQDILVLNEYQRMGIGASLLNKIINQYKTVYQMVLLTENEPKTRAFYESIGFKASDEFGCMSFVKFNN